MALCRLLLEPSERVVERTLVSRESQLFHSAHYVEMEFSQHFFSQHDDSMLDVYPLPQFQASIPEFDEESYNQGSGHTQDPNIISTFPMQRPVIPSLEDAAEAEDTSTRPRLTQEQIAVLEDNFKSKPKPGTDFKKQLASRIGLSLQRVNVSRVCTYL